jgi:cytoskeletal protein CcmA (bactofilin family)
MWRWKGNHSAARQKSTSVIDQGCELEGRLTFTGTLVFNGKFQGELLSSDTLFVGETGHVKANVEVGVAIVNGEITGNVTARDRVELRAKARIIGDIVTPVLLLEEGVVFEGHCQMKNKEPPTDQKAWKAEAL